MMQPGWNPYPLEMMFRGSMPPGTNPPATDTKQQTNPEAQNDEETKKQAVISKFQNVEGFKESMADDLTTGSIAIKQVPKKRLYEFLEFLKPGMDAVTLGGLNQTELAVVIWILSGMRPNSGIHEFNCKTYIELFVRARTAMQHRANAGKIDDLFFQKLLSMEDDDQRQTIMDHALDCGFNPQWLEKQKSSKQQDKKIAQTYSRRSSQKTSVG